MAASSADDHLTVGGNANVVDSASAEQKASAIGLAGHWLMVPSERCTQCMPLSAPFTPESMPMAYRLMAKA